MLNWLKSLFAGEDPEAKQAREKMAIDRQDPRKLFVWGILCMAEEHDPGWKPSYATTAITEWYGIADKAALLAQTADGFRASGHPAYDQFRLAFLARAGFGAGMLTEAESWDLAFRAARAVQRTYPDWTAYGAGYRDGHLAYRASCGDPPDQLAQYRQNLDAKIAEKQRTVWVAVPWASNLA
jgi:hypothetical protein